MLIETDEVVLLDDAEDLAESLVGGIWTEFKRGIPEPQAKILVEGFNLIILSNPPEESLLDEDPNEVLDGDPDAVTAVTSSLLPNMVTNLLVDESLTTSQQKMGVYALITNNIIETLLKMGFELNEDEANSDKLVPMCRILKFFYEMDSYEDLIGIADLLMSTDIDPTQRFLLAMQKYLGENEDLTEYETLLVDVSEVTLKTIADNLKLGEVSEAMPETLVNRVRANADFIRGTLAFNHVINNGQLGGPVESFIAFFGDDLNRLMEDPTEANVREYARELAGIYLISEVNTPVLKEKLLEFLYTIITDHMTLIHVETYLSQLVLDHDEIGIS